MKILVLQLARLGDIVQTWPVLRALKRADPTGEIHLLTRSKFAGAVEGCEAIDRHWCLDSRAILTPLIDEKPAIDTSLEMIAELCDELRLEGFDRVINLSFSALSSHLTRDIAMMGAQVVGYSRHHDGYLAIPDDASAYFYGQVGADRANRVHLTDLFAAIAGVQLEATDWRGPSAMSPEAVAIAASLNRPIVIHAGASDLSKTLSWSRWLNVVKGLLESYDGDVVLVGSAEEREISEKIAGLSGSRQPVNLVGRTTLSELFCVIQAARLVIGGDSGPMNIASLVGTPVLNLSFPIVSFWETGPKSPGSRIVRVESEDQIASDMIVREAMSMLTGGVSALACAFVENPVKPYFVRGEQPKEFEWQLTEALYMGGEFPQAQSSLFMEGVKRLSEVSTLALEQIATLGAAEASVEARKAAGQILERTDEIIAQIARMVPELSPVVRWFQTEQMRIGPMPTEQLIEITRAVHVRLGEVLALYEGAKDHDNVVLG